MGTKRTAEFRQEAVRVALIAALAVASPAAARVDYSCSFNKGVGMFIKTSDGTMQATTIDKSFTATAVLEGNNKATLDGERALVLTDDDANRMDVVSNRKTLSFHMAGTNNGGMVATLFLRGMVMEGELVTIVYSGECK